MELELDGQCRLSITRAAVADGSSLFPCDSERTGDSGAFCLGVTFRYRRVQTFAILQ